MSHGLTPSEPSTRPVSPLSELEDDDEIEPVNPGVYDQMSAPLPTSSFHSPDPTCPNYMVLETNFDINNEENKKIPYPRPDDERRIWTDKQRVLASQAMVPEDAEDFALKVGISDLTILC